MKHKIPKIIFKIFKKIEIFFCGRNLRRIPGILPFYHKLWLPFCDLLYDKFRPRGIVLINVQGNKMYLDANDRSITPTLLTECKIEKYESELFKDALKEGMVVVDVGAHIGYYSLIAAKLVGKKGLVYAFEPEPSNYKLLCKNIEVNGYTNVVLVKKAVSNKKGKSKFWFNKSVLACSSFSKDNVLVFSRDRFLEKDNFLETETITLDDFFNNVGRDTKVDVIKMDTQGAEGLIIEGAKKILTNNNLKIFTEFWPDGLKNLGTDPLELLQKLQDYGFQIKLINERKQVLEPIEIFQFSKRVKPCDEFNLLLEK